MERNRKILKWKVMRHAFLSLWNDIDSRLSLSPDDRMNSSSVGMICR